MHGTLPKTHIGANASDPHDLSFYMEGGREKGVLLIHGLTGAPVEMRFIAKALNRLGFTVYAPLLAGHGRDETALNATTYQDWIESLKKPLDRLKNEVEKVYTVGICVGGALGLMLAHQEPGKVEKSVIYSPTLYYDGWSRPFWQKHKLLERIFDIGYHFKPMHTLKFEEKHPYGIKDERMRRFLVEGASMKGILPFFTAISLYWNVQLNRAIRATLPKMTTPTLLIHAKEDDVSHPRNSELIQKLHGGACDAVYLENSYHMIHVDQERDLVAQLTADFMGLPSDAQNPDVLERLNAPIMMGATA